MRFHETIGISYTIKVLENELTNQMDALLKKFGLTFSQYTVLSILEEHKCLTNAELARKCFVTPQTMIRITTALSEARLIKKQASHDRRFGLTPKAVRLVCDAHVAVNDLERVMVHGMTAKEIGGAKNLLERLNLNLKKDT